MLPVVPSMLSLNHYYGAGTGTKDMCGSGIGYQINFNYDTCITGKVIYRHKGFKYVSTTKSKFSACLLHGKLQINQYCL